MRTSKFFFFIVDGGATPKAQLKHIIEDGCVECGYSCVEYSVDSSGDTSIYYKIAKT